MKTYKRIYKNLCSRENLCRAYLRARKGKSNKVAQVVISPLREHSRKPDEIRGRIVELLGNLPRIELFSRQSVPGWDCWGNETTKFNSKSKNGK